MGNGVLQQLEPSLWGPGMGSAVGGTPLPEEAPSAGRFAGSPSQRPSTLTTPLVSLYNDVFDLQPSGGLRASEPSSPASPAPRRPPSGLTSQSALRA